VGTNSVATDARVRRARWQRLLERLQGSPVLYDVDRYAPALARINALGVELRRLSDGALQQRGAELRARARAGEPRRALRDACYALVREAATRTLGQRPFDTQVLAALALDDEHVVEMQTGEGKTLAAVMPAALNALGGLGVHVLTFNDYLATRDADWMGPVYRLLGFSVACIQQGMPTSARRDAYAADITYLTAKEAGFDHLRDLLAVTEASVVHRPTLHLAIADEADSLLIDEAGVPLVVAGRLDRHERAAPELVEIVAALARGTHFDTDEYARSVGLTDAGVDQVERALGCGALHDSANLAVLSAVNCALHARVLLRRDVDYIVRDGRIELVDEHTGRPVPDRHWPDGLHAALEAKEGLGHRGDGRILASITLQRFLRRYSRLCGMTGTAVAAADELRQTYGRDVLVIPPHRPVVRIDRDDVLFTHREAKERAVVDEIRRAHAIRRPVLVGTATVAESERLAARLAEARIPCQVLNAKHDAEEAAIIARAGALGSVTIATNMAGRGTDIRLGGPDEADRERVAALGGLYVVGTNRHESRRVDLQLRGRAGRQGDPGESRFFVSLEDDLLVRYGVQGLIPARLMPPRTDAPIEHALVAREVARTQRIVEGQQLEIRRTLARYAAIVEDQHAIVAARRQALLQGETTPGRWQRQPDMRDRLVSAAGEAAVVAAERVVTLAAIDRVWCDHLAFCEHLREGIHLVRLGGEDPLTRFAKEVVEAFGDVDEWIDRFVMMALPKVRVVEGAIDLSAAGLTAPAATWTYLVNDDPFRSRIGALLTGPGGATVAIYSAALLTPLLLLWAIVERWHRGRASRRREIGAG
jgi:preprotein translocase subunit SecA